MLFWRTFTDVKRSPTMLLLHFIVALTMSLLVGALCAVPGTALATKQGELPRLDCVPMPLWRCKLPPSPAMLGTIPC